MEVGLFAEMTRPISFVTGVAAKAGAMASLAIFVNRTFAARRYPICWATNWTRLWVSGVILHKFPRPESTRETVETETPAASETRCNEI